jgi:hypothetical protein
MAECLSLTVREKRLPAKLRFLRAGQWLEEKRVSNDAN